MQSVPRNTVLVDDSSRSWCGPVIGWLCDISQAIHYTEEGAKRRLARFEGLKTKYVLILTLRGDKICP